MKTTTAFRAFRNRRLDKANARGEVSLRAVTKSGALSKVLHREVNGTTRFTREEADAIKARLEGLNPGKFWSVVEG